MTINLTIAVDWADDVLSGLDPGHITRPSGVS